MIQNLYVTHRKKPDVFTAVPHGVVWETCLRSICVASAPVPGTVPSDEQYAQDGAYRFLLEIACGLHSPIVGETEVFGQFKAFAARWLETDPARAALVQRLLADTKNLRRDFLTGLGTQSYGGVLKRRLSAARAHILGGGQLAQEILPYLVSQATDVVLHVRDPRRVTFHQGDKVHALEDRRFDSGALVIAAPVESRAIRSWLGPIRPEQIFDLRDTSATDPLRLAGVRDHHGLHDVFKCIEETRERLVPVIGRMREEIRARAEDVSKAPQLRPQGWDDLCA